jgi:hypothetical protein
MTRIVSATLFGLLVIATLLYAGEYFAVRRYGLDSEQPLGSYGRLALLTLATYAGIVGQVLTVRLKASKAQRISIRDELRETTSGRDFWMAIIASPLVLAAAYNAVAEVHSVLLVGVVAFQNGFFFHAILSRDEAAARRR